VVPNLTFGAQERYGIGLPRDSHLLDRCRALTDKLKEFMTNGAWETFFHSNFGDLDATSHKPDPFDLDECE
jgi:glutamate transport system substrate-binding protein